MGKPTPYQAACHETCAGSGDEWFTPPEIIRALGRFDLDPACGRLCRTKTACRRFSSNGLDQVWRGRVWLNPPFSNAKPWVEKLAAHGNGILLCFARTDAKWFQLAARKANGLFLFLGRLRFQRPNGRSGRCPLGCVLLAFGDANWKAIEAAKFTGLEIPLS